MRGAEDAWPPVCEHWRCWWSRAGKLKASLSQIGLAFSTVFWKGVTLTLSVIMKRH